VLEACQHRVREKDAVRRLGIGTAEYRAVRSAADLAAAVAEIGAPAVLKTSRGGYDGKGQAVIREPGQAEAAYRSLGGDTREMILEGMVRFHMEISVVCARGPGGGTATFPVSENLHRNGILDTSVVPARVDDATAAEARRIATTLAEGLNVEGLLAVEMFVAEDGRVLVNELAPRPHNSGHYTMEACMVSQFEQQLRAVCGLPLGSTELLRPAAMVNLLGEDGGTCLGDPRVAQALGVPGVALHLYGKHEARPGRKMGHLTALGDTVGQALERARAARRIVRGSG
jgi:5-(carboxyamino)imidazole ribonucleotide synthase